MTDELPPLPELVPCPMCGNPDGYFLQEGCTYRWWNVLCKKCGRIIDECASDRRTTTGTVLPSRWPAADETWNEAGAYARAAVLAERERCAKVCDKIGERHRKMNDSRPPELMTSGENAAYECADAIRKDAP